MSILKRKAGSQCEACGVCCELFGDSISACEEDLSRWRAEGREDILAWVGPGLLLWVDPASGERGGCPFLRRIGVNTAHCSINSTKPAMCAAYPTPAHRGRCATGKTFSP